MDLMPDLTDLLMERALAGPPYVQIEAVEVDRPRNILSEYVNFIRTCTCASIIDLQS